jgi:hypothetical protein
VPSSQTDNAFEAKLRRLAEALPAAVYVGPRILQHPQGRSEWHVVSVMHENGRWQAVYCKTQEMAQAIEQAARYAERISK